MCFKRFHIFRNAKNWAWNSSPLAQWLRSKLCLRPSGQPRNDYTDRHDVNISLVIKKNRKYLLHRCAHLQSIFVLDVYSFIILSLWNCDKQSLRCQNVNAVLIGKLLGNLAGSMFCARSCHEMAAEAASILPSLTHQQQQPTVSGVAAVWICFKSVFVFQDLCMCCQSAIAVCVSQRQQWPSH